MAVPDTNTFSLQDVVNEFTESIDDLVHCVSNADAAGYNSSYYSSPATSLLEFRDYEETVSLTSFPSSAGGKNQSSVCQYASVNQTYYHDGSNATPVVGDTVYSDSAGTTPLAENNYKLNALGSYHIETVGVGNPATGVVDSLSPC
jgi:hypothetical protein